jgi:hypothetical protein
MSSLYRSLAAASVFAAATLLAQPVSPAWVQQTRGVSVALDASDNVYTVDHEQAPGAEMTLTKRDSAGNLLWVRFFDQVSTTTWERASWVTTDPMGNAIVCGTSMSGFSNPVEAASIVAKFDPSGSLLWRQVYESAFDGSSVRKCLADLNGNIYVLGMRIGPNGRVTSVKKFAPGGTALWSYFDAAGIGAALNFKFSPDGHIVIAAKGVSGSFMGYAKIDLNGNPIWSLPGVPSLTAGDAAGDSLGNTYLVHGQYVASNAGTVIKKLGPTGAILWERTYASSGFRVEVGSDDKPIVSGFPNSGSPGAAFFKTDANGTLLWANLDADGPLALLAHAHMLLDAGNNAYLAAGTMSEMAVCKINSDGSSSWTQTIPFGYAAAIALARTGSSSVYVVGGTTARLNQTGNPPPPPAPPSALAVSSVTTSSAKLSWIDNSSNETGFTVERCTGSLLTCASSSGWSVRATLATNSISFNDLGLAPQTAYSWRVKAVNSFGSSNYSNYVSATTLPLPPPNAPTNLTGQISRSGTQYQVKLTWTDNASNETGYRVERCTGSTCTSFASVASLAANTTTFTDATVSRRTTYRYRVAAVAGGAISPYSNVITVTVNTP